MRIWLIGWLKLFYVNTTSLHTLIHTYTNTCIYTHTHSNTHTFQHLYTFRRWLKHWKCGEGVIACGQILVVNLCCDSMQCVALHPLLFMRHKCRSCFAFACVWQVWCVWCVCICVFVWAYSFVNVSTQIWLNQGQYLFRHFETTRQDCGCINCHLGFEWCILFWVLLYCWSLQKLWDSNIFLNLLFSMENSLGKREK